MDAWLEEWLDYQSKKLSDYEAEKIRLKNVAHNLMNRRYWKGRN